MPASKELYDCGILWVWNESHLKDLSWIGCPNVFSPKVHCLMSVRSPKCPQYLQVILTAAGWFESACVYSQKEIAEIWPAWEACQEKSLLWWKWFGVESLPQELGSLQSLIQLWILHQIRTYLKIMWDHISKAVVRNSGQLFKNDFKKWFLVKGTILAYVLNLSTDIKSIHI